MKDFFKAFLAGIFIGIAGIVSLKANNYLSPFIFSTGLICIILCNLKLYTGIIGVSNDIREIVLVILGNFLGASIVGEMVNPDPSIELMLQLKLDKSYIILLVTAIFCGMLMYVATVVSKECNNRVLVIILCVAAFIIGGFEHSVADVFYFAIDGISSRDLWTLLIIALGNYIGAKTLHLATSIDSIPLKINKVRGIRKIR